MGKAFNDAWRQISPHVSTRADVVDAARLTLFEMLLNLTKHGTCDRDKLTEAAIRKMLEDPIPCQEDRTAVRSQLVGQVHHGSHCRID